jgi:hypothetical protein
MGVQYLLNFDDVLDASFMTKSNTDNLLQGINESDSISTLGVPNGGLGNPNFTPNQTVVFDGIKMVSSGYGPATVSGPLVNDDRYYTKTEIDAKFTSLASPGGFPVAYANIIGAPVSGAQLQFITPIQVYSGTTAMAAPAQYNIAPLVGHTIVGALVTVTCMLNGPDTGFAAVMMTSATAVSPQISSGWFRSAGGGDATAGSTTSIVPVDASSSSFFYQLIGLNANSTLVSSGTTVVSGGTPVVVTLIGYFFQ